MNRNEMIHVLQAIKDGKLSPESLQPSKFYVFTERTNNPGVYMRHGKTYSKDEYLSFKAKVEANTQHISLPDEIARHVNQSRVFLVTVVMPENMVPLAYSESDIKE